MLRFVSLCVLALACASNEDAPEPVTVEVAVGEEEPLPAPAPERLTPDEAQTAFVQRETPSSNTQLPSSTQIAHPSEPRAAGLEPARVHYSALHALSFTQTQSASIQVATRALMAAIDAGVDRVREVDVACDGVAAAAECTTLRADARDLLGVRIRSMQMPLPQDIELQIQRLAADMQAEIRAEVAARIREVLDARAGELSAKRRRSTDRPRRSARRNNSVATAPCRVAETTTPSLRGTVRSVR